MSFISTLSADGATTAVRCVDGIEYQIEAEGTWGSGTLTPQKKSYDGTWIALGDTTLTADGAINVRVPRGTEIRANLAGATNPSLKVHVGRVE